MTISGACEIAIDLMDCHVCEGLFCSDYGDVLEEALVLIPYHPWYCLVGLDCYPSKEIST